jgi:hypothetical protein
MQPAGRDPKAQFSPGNKDITAPFWQKCQSILSNLVAQLADISARHIDLFPNSRPAPFLGHV